MRQSKDTPRYEGPFVVIRREGSGNYLLKGIDGTEYSRPPQVLKMVGSRILENLKVPDTIFAAVDKILEHKDVEGVIYYRTRWKGQGPSQDSWLKQADFMDYGPLQKYEKMLARGGLNGDEDRDKEESSRAQKEGNLKVAKAGHKKQEKADTTEVVLDLDKEQLDAVGEYWKQMRSTRKRKVAIVESSDSE